MTVFVRPAREEDAVRFAEWYSKTETFNDDVFRFPETYTLRAFSSKKVLGFLVVRFDEKIQYLYRFVPNPEISKIEQAAACSELVKTVVTIGFLREIPRIYFVGNHSGTNRIASHIFKEVTYEEYSSWLHKQDYPVYGLKLKDLECLSYPQ